MNTQRYLAIQNRRQAFPSGMHTLPQKEHKAELTKAEAEALISSLANASTRVFSNVVLLVRKKGHLALGFQKPQDCLRKKVPELSNSYICRLLKAAETYIKLDHELKYIGKVAEATFRPLHNVVDHDAQAVWNQATAAMPDQGVRRMTARQIKRAMDELGVVSETTVKQRSLTVKPCMLKVDDAMRRNVKQYAKRLSSRFIFPHVRTKDEWEQLAGLIYQQLLDECPIQGQALYESSQVRKQPSLKWVHSA